LVLENKKKIFAESKNHRRTFILWVARARALTS